MKPILGLFLVIFLKCRGTDALIGQCSARKVLTYNAALLDHALSEGLPNNRMPRREAQILELRRLDADIVCLQEIWIGQDVERIVHALSDVYGYSYSKLHLPGKLGGYLPSQEGPSMPPCNHYGAIAFSTCARQNRCLGKKKPEAQVFACLNFHCYHQYKRLSQKCVTCMAASWGKLNKIFKNCVGIGLPAINMRTMNEPGLLLLSKRPLLKARYTDFHPYTKELIERGYIEADTQDIGKVVCTHTTNNKPDYREMELLRKGVFTSYVEQGHSERTELVKKFGHSYPIVLTGDFNIGGAFGPFINQDLPDEFRYLAWPFEVTPLQQCTLCWPHENIYKKTSTAILNTVVDHVFYKGHKVVKMLRVLTPGDTMIDNLPLSDHNGVMAVFSVCR